MTNNETALENQAINPGAESIAQSLGNARQNGDWFNCTCPCCADDGAHLGIRDTDDDKILVNCFHDCPKKAILAALAARGLYIPARRGKLTGTLVSPIPPGALPKPMAFDAFRVSAPEGFTAKKLWWYCNEQGEYLFGIVRFEQPRNLFLPIEERPPKPEKTFRPLTLWRKESGALKWHLKAAPRPWPLWNLPLLARDPSAGVIVCEGEKAASAAALIYPQHICVSPAHGAKAPESTDWSPLCGRDVTIWPDNDDPGAKFAGFVTALCLAAGAKTVCLFNVSQFPASWDAADALAAFAESSS
jgi:hypothetical protein